MINNFKESPDNFRDYNSELLLRIQNKTSFEIKTSDDKELFVDANLKINSKNKNCMNSLENSNLKKLLSEIFPDKNILIQDNNDGSQTIFIS